MMESRMTRKCHVRFGKRDRETRFMQVNKVRSVPTSFSPLLANIYLHSLDKYWQLKHEGWHTKLVRYCDDFVVLIRGKDPKPYMDSLTNFLNRIKLSLSVEKTKVIEANEGFEFLGVRLKLQETRNSKTRQFCYGFPSKKSMKQIRHCIRQEIGKNYQQSLAHKIAYLNPVLRGWANYHNWLNSSKHFKKIDKYTSKKLNIWLRIKHGAKRKKYRWLSNVELQQCGLYRLGGKIAHV
jgi:RNA-directed DNA polymerase